MAQSHGQQLGERGEDLFRYLLPDGWLKHKRNPDPHVDFIVERVSAGELTGDTVYFQVKSTARSMRGRHLYANIEVDTLRYATRSRLPVFVALIDIASSRGFFRSLSEYVDTLPSESPVWSQRYHRVPLDTAWQLSDEVRLAEAVSRSLKLLSEKFPGSMEAAAAAAAKDIMIRDDRFAIQVGFDGSGRVYTCIPLRDDVSMSVQIRATGDEAKARLQDFIKRGGRVDSSDGIEVLVSDLPGGFGEIVKCGMTIKSVEPGSLKWDLLDNDGRVLGSHLQSIEWHWGLCGIAAEVRFGGGKLLSFSAMFDFQDRSDNSGAIYSLRADVTQWDGLSVLALPHFYEMAALFGRATDASGARITLIKNLGEFSSIVAEKEFEPIRAMGAFIRLAGMLRDIARKTQCCIQWDSSIVSQQHDDIVALHDFLFNEFFPTDDIILEIGASVDSVDLHRVKNMTSLRIERTARAEILGVNLGELHITVYVDKITNVQVEATSDSGFRVIASPGSVRREVKLVKSTATI